MAQIWVYIQFNHPGYRPGYLIQASQNIHFKPDTGLKDPKRQMMGRKFDSITVDNLEDSGSTLLLDCETSVCSKMFVLRVSKKKGPLMFLFNTVLSYILSLSDHV